jgi:serine/threonine protein kinase
MPEAENLDKRVSERTAISPSSTPTGVSSGDSHITKKHTAPLIGSVVGGAELDKLIGSGGMSDVYHGTFNGKEVAVKVLQSRHITDDGIIKRFAEDAKATETLEHPHIVKTLASGTEGNVPYIVYQFIQGADTLSKASLSKEDNARVMLQIAKALDYAHNPVGKPRIIHRDVKPENIIIQKSPVKGYLLDFGIGKIIDESRESVTEEKEFLGTPEYMSPEQAADAKDVGPKSDVYSWACTAYAIHTMARPTEQPMNSSQKKTLEESMRSIKHRMNTQMLHELWLNDVIELTFADRVKSFGENPEKKAIDVLKNRYTKVSDRYEELIHRVLCGKKIDERPSFEMIIPRLEDLIDKNLVKERQLTEAEQSEQGKFVKEIEKLASERKAEVERLGKEKDKVEHVNKLYVLGETLTTLADLLPVADESRGRLYQEAFGYLTDVHAEIDILIRRGGKVKGIEPESVDNWRSWTASGLRIVQERKRRSQTRLSEQEYEDLFNVASKALADDNLVDAAACYQRIDHALVPTASKTKFDSLTQRFEEAVNKLVSEGEKSLPDFDSAEKQYNRARLLSDVLPETSEVRSKVSGLNLLVEYEKLDSKYKSAESGKDKDYYSMLQHAQNMQVALDNPVFPAAHRDSYKGRVDKHFEELKPKELHLNILEQLIKNTDALMEELGKESQDKTESEANVRSLSSERIDYYKRSIESVVDTFATLKKENIGPKYDELKTSLDFFKEDLQIETWKRGVGSTDWNETYSSLNSLINHYRNEPETTKEKLYLHLRMNLDKKRLGEIENK